MSRILIIAANTFREAVRDRILYNLIFFALLMVAAAPLIGQISIGVERVVLINLGLTAIAIFGVLIGIFIGTGLVSKEIDRRTLYSVLSRPVRRWEFILGKYAGLAATLAVNALAMAAGFFLALYFVTRSFGRADLPVLGALYLILLQYLLITALALLFSSFTTPTFSMVFSFAMFVIGSFADDLRGFALLRTGAERWAVLLVSYIVPNFGSLNVVSQAAHGAGMSAAVLVQSSVYTFLYAAVALSAAVLIFERRNLK